MEKKCKYIKEIERKNKKIKVVILIIIICILASILLAVHWNKLGLMFYNDNGIFSNEIFWSAIGAIGSILALIGVIVTIIYTEYSRRKQNEYEFKKEQLLQEHSEFKEEVKEQLEILDPIRVLESTIKIEDRDNFNEMADELNNYIIKIKSIDYKIYWYYNRTMQGNYIELNNFMNELNIFIKYMTEQINEYNETICSYYKKIKKDNIASIENALQFVNETGDIKNKIVDYRNDKWHIIVEKAKLMIEEREKVIKEKLN